MEKLWRWTKKVARFFSYYNVSTWESNLRNLEYSGGDGYLSVAQTNNSINGACFLLVVVATRQWKQPTLPAKLQSESFFESFGTIIRYARNAPGFQFVLARNF